MKPKQWHTLYHQQRINDFGTVLSILNRGSIQGSPKMNNFHPRYLSYCTMTYTCYSTKHSNWKTIADADLIEMQQSVAGFPPQNIVWTIA